MNASYRAHTHGLARARILSHNHTVAKEAERWGVARAGVVLEGCAGGGDIGVCVSVSVGA